MPRQPQLHERCTTYCARFDKRASCSSDPCRTNLGKDRLYFPCIMQLRLSAHEHYIIEASGKDKLDWLTSKSSDLNVTLHAIYFEKGRSDVRLSYLTILLI